MHIHIERDEASCKFWLRPLTLAANHGFSPLTLVMKKEALEAALTNNPYASHKVEPKCIHFFFLAATPTDEAVEDARALAKGREELTVIDQVLYLLAPDGIARSKLAAGAEKALGVSATARNLRSVEKILQLALKTAA